ncbi:MAG: hypothetical protein AAGA30_13100, partial [Planctomycetota bacterium]
TAVMRACSLESADAVKRMYLWSSIGFMIRFIIPQFLGICALAYFLQHQNLTDYFFVTNQDGNQLEVVADRSLSAMPVFLSQLLPIGVIGLVGAGMLAAFMSTHDTYLLCWSSVCVEDVINPLVEKSRGRSIAEPKRIQLTRFLLVLIAGFLLIWSMWYPLGQDLWDYMAISGAIYFVGAFVVLTAGVYWTRASKMGAYWALTAGGINVIGLHPVQEFLSIELSGATVGLSAIVLSGILMVAGSIMFPDRLNGRELVQ